jgi:hypothetical protein
VCVCVCVYNVPVCYMRKCRAVKSLGVCSTGLPVMTVKLFTFTTEIVENIPQQMQNLP